MSRAEILYLCFAALSLTALLWVVGDSVATLEGGGAIDAIHEVYHFNSDVLTFGIPAITIVLLGGAVYLEWTTKRIRYFLVTGVFYAVLTLADYLVVCEMYFQWLRQTGQWKGGFSTAWILGLVLVFLGMIVVSAALWLTRTIREIIQQK